jgi:DNA-binding NtrC family response regulator
VRVISATNADLEERVKRGEFREDLYYRLNVIPILLPPLRERREDIPLLAKHFLKKICIDMNRPQLELTNEAIRTLEGYGWPGNVREMENVIERAIALTESDVIGQNDLPSRISGISQGHDNLPTLHIPEEGLDLAETVEQVERTLIKQAMEKSKNVKARAASLLNLNRTTLVEKIKRYDM